MSKILLLDNCNFTDYPPGGTLSFAKQLLKVIPHEHIALVGGTTQKEMQIGEWSKTTIDGKEYDFLPIMKYDPVNRKPLVPLRIQSLAALARYRDKINSKHILHFFSQTPQFAFGIRFFNRKSFFFCFAGLANSVDISRYKYLRFLGTLYERMLLRILRKQATHIAAASDSKTIREFSLANSHLLRGVEIKSLPTRYDPSIFFVRNKSSCRDELRLPANKPILISTGRISWVKGWDFILQSYLEWLRTQPNSMLVFVGDGEDRARLERKYQELIVKNLVKVTGFVPPEMVAKYLSASDVFLMGSFHEGWSTSMLEAVACGKPIVATDVSSASDLVISGENGFVVKERDPELFSKYIARCIGLPNASGISVRIAQRYSLDTLLSDIKDQWPEIQELF